jgi:quinol monooxygenase YgiN
MIVLYASIPIKPDKRNEAIELAETLVDRSNHEDGIVDYQAAIDVQNKNTLRFFEQYEDEAAVEAHTQTDHYQEFEAVLPDLLDGEPELFQFDISTVSELEI